MEREKGIDFSKTFEKFSHLMNTMEICELDDNTVNCSKSIDSLISTMISGGICSLVACHKAMSFLSTFLFTTQVNLSNLQLIQSQDKPLASWMIESGSRRFQRTEKSQIVILKNKLGCYLTRDLVVYQDRILVLDSEKPNYKSCLNNCVSLFKSISLLNHSFQ